MREHRVYTGPGLEYGMYGSHQVCVLGLTWRASTVDSSVVVLTDGEVQRRTWFRNVLFPWFARSIPYPAERETHDP